jgi:hypothetical protein
VIRLALAVFLLFFPMVLKPSSRGGVGTGEHTGSCAALRALRTSWVMNWGSKPAWVEGDCPEIEFVPMAWGGYGTGWEARAIERDWLATHPDSYVLVLNEPNDPYQANLTCEEAGQSVEQYANDIWADYPSARLIVGGILTGDYDGRSVARGIEYATCMVANISPTIYARIDGWHWHWYPFFSTDAETSRNGITQLATWTHAQGKQFWLSEVGLIGWAAAWPDAEPWMREMVRWLDGDAPVERWAWFIMQRDPVWPCPQTLELWDANGMTAYGQIYSGR